MHDGTYLSYLGLSELETKVLKSIFTLAPQLKENFALIPPEQIERADLILVNGDDPVAIRTWTDLRKENNLLASLMLTDSADLVGAAGRAPQERVGPHGQGRHANGGQQPTPHSPNPTPPLPWAP